MIEAMTDLRDVRRFAVRFCAALAVTAAALPAQAEDAKPSARDDRATCDRGEFKIILDVGHTTESPGAFSARGASEYGFNFFLTRQIERQLRAAGFAKTQVLITTGKARPSLALRIARANKLGGQLFVSIHHDSVPQKFKDKWSYDGRKFEFSDRFKGHSIFVSQDSHDLRGSLLFGKLLGHELKARGMAYTPHYKEKFMGNRQRPLLDALTGVYSYDKLLVLKHTHMPAVLLEAGNIVNREEEMELLSEERQLTTAAAVAQAVDSFCAARMAPQPQLVAQRARPRHIGKPTVRRRSATLEASALKRR